MNIRRPTGIQHVYCVP